MYSGLIQRVAVIAGVHGNEWTGIHLVKKFQQSPELIERSTFETLTLLANLKAIEANLRYIDKDLNRCFSKQDLSNLELVASYEDRRAKEIAALLRPSNQPNVDVIIDLHSTTANMGMTIFPTSTEPFNLGMCDYLSACYPEVRVCFGERYGQESPLLRSLAPYGCVIEVGSVPQGVLNARQLQQTEMLVHAILNYVDAHNQGNLRLTSSNLTVYHVLCSVDYPRDAAGELQAVIHPQLQFQDYKPLNPGDPMFLTSTGEMISFQGKTTVFPVFINEAAYYEKHIAMILTEKQQLELKAV
jgi:succinylglutamate desuccinylase